jgi:alpha-beta hydrolase superfamily lysophospholipase
MGAAAIISFILKGFRTERVSITSDHCNLRTKLAALLGVLVLAGCAPTVIPAGQSLRPPVLEDRRFVAADGTVLPVAVWPAGKSEEKPPRAVIVAVHGFGDYHNAWQEPAEIWAANGITTYAYDQRGFGASPTRGRWAGTTTMVDDIRAVVQLVRARHPGVPLYLAGESMGGALAIVAAEHDVDVDGLILVAAAVRSRDTLGPLLSGALDFFAHLVPWLPSGPTSIDFRPTDNPKTIEKLRNDPMILRNARLDLGYGLVEAMDAAKAAVPRINKPYILLYGLGDRLVPQASVRSAIELMPKPAGSHLAFYREGYHMLLRDKEGALVARDILAWIENKNAALPSGADARYSRPDLAALWGSKQPD